jgi:hypothetical protein
VYGIPGLLFSGYTVAGKSVSLAAFSALQGSKA